MIQKQNLKKLFFIFFIFLSLPFLVSAGSIIFPSGISATYSNVHLNETFEFSDTVVNHGWTTIGACGTEEPQFTKLPYNYSLATKFSDCPSSGFTHESRKTFYTANVTEEQYIIKFDFYSNGTIGSGSDDWILKLTNTTGAGTAQFSFTEDDSHAVDVAVLGAANANCSIPYAQGAELWDDFHEIILTVDFTKNQWSFYLDGSCGSCCALGLGPDINLAAISYLYQKSANTNFSRALDNILILNGTASSEGLGCQFPILFCDTFDYASPLADHGWYPLLSGGSMDLSFTPHVSQLQLYDSFISAIYPKHEIPETSIHAYLTESNYIESTKYSPVTSAEWVMYLYNNTYASIAECPSYYIASRNYPDAQIYFCSNNSIYYLANYAATSYGVVCDNCIPVEQNALVKITAYFKQRAYYDVNSTIMSDSIDIAVNNVVKGSINSFLYGADSDNWQYSQFIKNDGNDFSVDNYYVFAGTDKYVSTLALYYHDRYVYVNETFQLGSGETGDFATDIGSMYDNIGLKSKTSRYFFGMIVLIVSVVLCAFGLMIISGQTGIPISGGVLLAITSIVFISMAVLLAYLQLLPWWLIFLVALLLVVYITFAISKSASSGAG
jgi:hypothetical protein